MRSRAAGGAAVRGSEMGLAQGGLTIEGAAVTFSWEDTGIGCPEVWMSAFQSNFRESTRKLYCISKEIRHHNFSFLPYFLNPMRSEGLLPLLPMEEGSRVVQIKGSAIL